MYMTRKQIFDHIWTRTVLGFAKDYDLNYERLLKLIKENDIPKPSRQEQMYIREGEVGLKSIHRPELPGDPTLEIELPRKRTAIEAEEKHERRRRALKRKGYEAPPIDYENHPRWGSLYFLAPAERRKVISETEKIKLLHSGTMHPRASAYQEDIDAWKSQVSITGNEYYVEHVAGRPMLLDSVSVESSKRVIAMLDTLYTSIEYLGGSVLENGSVEVHGETVDLSFQESKTRVRRESFVQEELEGDGKSGNKWAYRFTGKLTLNICYLYSLRDRKSASLEDRLGEVLEMIYLAAYQLSKARAEIVEIEADEQSFSREIERTEALLNQARDYDDACRIRTLILAVQKQLPSADPDLRQQFPEWAAWASGKADWLDPTVDYGDPILGRRHDSILLTPSEES